MMFYILLAFLLLVALFFLLGWLNAKNHYKNCSTYLHGRCINTDCVNCTIYKGEE